MEVTSYFREEVADLITDSDSLAEWKRIVSELKLTGQDQLCENSKSPIPFLAVNATLRLAIETLCPRQCLVNEYRFDTIPLPVAKLISLSVQEKYFSEIRIAWDDKQVDPFAYGIVGLWKVFNNNWNNIGEYESEKEAREAHPKAYSIRLEETGRYLIARWGAEAKAISQLIIDAKERWVKKEATEANRLIRDGQQRLSDLEIRAAEMFG